MSVPHGILRSFLFETSNPQIRISGRSMAPFLTDGDLHTVEPVRGTLRPGTIYVYANTTKMIVHRFVCMMNQTAVFWGDRCLRPECVPLYAVFGTCKEKNAHWNRCMVTWINRFFLYIPWPAAQKIRRRLVGLMALT